MDEPVPVRLMNTIWADRNAVYDALVTIDDLRTWLKAIGETPGRITKKDVEAFRTLRDALRELAALVTEDTRPGATTPTEQAVANVNRAVTRATTWPQLTLEQGQLTRRTTGITTPLSRIATEAIDVLTQADLRACYAPGCVLYFIKDHPRREWCGPACGNRARAARHYQRHHPTATPRTNR